MVYHNALYALATDNVTTVSLTYLPTDVIYDYMLDRLKHLRAGIGHTPLIDITATIHSHTVHLYAKAEWYNITGSIKDRPAYHILLTAYRDGTLSPGQPIVETSSGNMGISLSAIGAMLGHPVHIFMPDSMSAERVSLMQNFGATVHLVPAHLGFAECLRRMDILKAEIHAFCPHQFANAQNTYSHYTTTAEEMISQLPTPPDAFVSGVGTGGTLIGVGTRLKSTYPDLRVIALEPAQSQILRTGVKGLPHRIAGIGDEFVPDIYDPAVVDDYITVTDDEALSMTRLLNAHGIGVGISSGANACAMLKLAHTHHYTAIATVFADDNKKYLSQDISHNYPHTIADDTTITDITYIR